MTNLRIYQLKTSIFINLELNSRRLFCVRRSFEDRKAIMIEYVDTRESECRVIDESLIPCGDENVLFDYDYGEETEQQE